MHKNNTTPSDGPEPENGFGARLRQLRQRFGLSVPSFARQVGFHRTYVYRLETGAAENPSLKFIESVTRNFGVDREWFMGGVGHPSPLIVKTEPKATPGGYIRMRFEVLQDLLETYDEQGLAAAEARFNELAKVDQQFGKVFDELHNIAAYMSLFRQAKKSEMERGKTMRKRKAK